MLVALPLVVWLAAPVVEPEMAEPVVEPEAAEAPVVMEPGMVEVPEAELGGATGGLVAKTGMDEAPAGSAVARVRSGF